MSIAKHTPGPWAARIMSCGMGSVCTVYGTTEGWVEIYAPEGSDADDWRAESSANARLIAAAPDLLEALKSIVKSLADQDDEGLIEHAQQMIDARAAIAKATQGTA